MDKCEFDIRIDGIPYTLSKNKPKKYNTGLVYDGKIKLNSITYTYQSVADFNWTLTNFITGKKEETIENKEALMYYLDHLKYKKKLEDEEAVRNRRYEEHLKDAAAIQKRLFEIGEEIELQKAKDIIKEREKEKEQERIGAKIVEKSRKIRNKLKNIEYDENKAIVCVGVMQDVGKNNGGIFVVRQKKDEKWMLPGGILDPPQKLNTSNQIILGDQEGAFSGLSREILEETGININGNIPRKFRKYKYFNTETIYNGKPLWACVVHMIVTFPNLITINELFETRTDHQNPSETTEWGFYNIYKKTIQTIDISSGSKKLVKSPKYRRDFTNNLNKVINSCIEINKGIL